MGKESLRIWEVGPRDGLQTETTILTTEDKSSWINELIAAGIRFVEAGSFVNPRAVPAMADSGDVIRSISARKEQLISALVLNEKGLDLAIEAGVRGVGLVTMASESLCLKNNRRTVKEATLMAQTLAMRAKAAGLFVRVNLSPAWHCPYEGPMPPEKVLKVLDQLTSIDADEICLCDTIGAGLPNEVEFLFEQAKQFFDVKKLAAHFHDTKSCALANVKVALIAGVRIFDSSAGGIGGCPFAPGARGNVATEDLVLMAEQMGYDTGIDLDKLGQAIHSMGQRLGRAIGGQRPSWLSVEGPG